MDSTPPDPYLVALLHLQYLGASVGVLLILVVVIAGMVS